MDVLTIILSVFALGISLWQGFLSKQQLDQAKETKSDTEKLLDEIKSKVQKIETLSDETRKDVKDQIAKLIDQQNENFKTLLSNPVKSQENEMMMQIMGQAMQNPEMLKTLMEISTKTKDE